VCARASIDEQGAGDSFIGALAYYISRHGQLTLREQVARAMSIASHSVQSAGTQTSYATKHELDAELFL
jgi:ribokinase